MGLLPQRKFNVVVDAGCGTGRQTLVLAAELDTLIHAVDSRASFLGELSRRARAAKLERRVQTHCMDMKDIPNVFHGIDLLWSEGAAYSIGFGNAFATWARAIVPGGFAIASELTWLKDSPSGAAIRKIRNECNEKPAARIYACTMKTRTCAAILTLTAAVGQTPAASDAPVAGPCASGAFRELDFWAGDWKVHDAAGKLAGRNKVTIEERGCVVVERWHAANGSTGQSLNYYDPAAKRWKQRWAGLGLLIEMDGGLQGQAMVLEGPMQYLGTNRTTLLRGTWTRLSDGRLHQVFVESDDGGKTWKPWFDGYYTPAAP